MARIDVNSIMSKVNSYAGSSKGKDRMEKKIKEYREGGVSKTDAGGSIITLKDMCTAAEEMIKLLQVSALQCGLPQSVLDHFASLTYRQPKPVGNGNKFYTVDIYFQDDMSRMSLLITSGDRVGQRTGDGIRNIVSLFNTGYDASSQVYGLWEGVGNVVSKQSRDGLHFIEQAVQEFNNKWGAKYNVQALVVSTEYLT